MQKIPHSNVRLKQSYVNENNNISMNENNHAGKSSFVFDKETVNWKRRLNVKRKKGYKLNN